MIKDYKESWVEEITEYELVFYVERGGGCAFPCDENGNVDRDSLCEPAIRNLDHALAHPEKYPYAWNKVEKNVRRFRNPASGICNCGERIDLYNEYLGGCECPCCGQWWNIWGQELNNPETWSQGDDW